jgi:hypothetical protein
MLVLPRLKGDVRHHVLQVSHTDVREQSRRAIGKDIVAGTRHTKGVYVRPNVIKLQVIRRDHRKSSSKGMSGQSNLVSRVQALEALHLIQDAWENSLL